MLFAKPLGQGQAPYDVPSILDFNDFADVEGFRDHSTYSSRSLLRVGDIQIHDISVAVHNFAEAAIPSVRTPSLNSFLPFSMAAPCAACCCIMVRLVRLQTS
jgi:hypothetical protein